MNEPFFHVFIQNIYRVLQKGHVKLKGLNLHINTNNLVD